MIAAPGDDASKTRPSPHADVVTTRVNVAFPFSQIKVQEPSDDLAALAALVRDVADLLHEAAPVPKAQELAERAKTLAARLK